MHPLSRKPISTYPCQLFLPLFPMPSLSPERGRSRSRHFVEPDPSMKQNSTPRRSISPRTASRTPPKNGGPHDRRNGAKVRSRSPRRTPSGSRNRDAGRSKRYRERSYSRSRSRTPIPKSSKVSPGALLRGRVAMTNRS